eukprot:2113509-Amphidinium_carterae.1
MPLVVILLNEFRAAAMVGVVAISTALAFSAGFLQLQHLGKYCSVPSLDDAWGDHVSADGALSLDPNLVSDLYCKAVNTCHAGADGYSNFDWKLHGVCGLVLDPEMSQCTLHTWDDTGRLSEIALCVRNDASEHATSTILVDRSHFQFQQPFVLVDTLDDVSTSLVRAWMTVTLDTLLFTPRFEVLCEITEKPGMPLVC